MLAASGVAGADGSLAERVPTDVGFYVELRNADDLLLPLTDPHAWLTLAELGGQPARLEESERWSARVEDTIRMSPAQAIRVLLSDRVAFVSAGVRKTQDAVVLCKPRIRPASLIQRWHANPLPTTGRTAVYRLPHRIGLGLHDDTLVFGDFTAQGMFDHLVAHLDAPEVPSLAENDIYNKLLARVPAAPDGVLFARLGEGRSPTTNPAPLATRPAPGPVPQLPRLMRHSDNLLVALHRNDRALRFTIVGDAAGFTPPRPDSLTDIVSRLPEQTLLTWAGHLDYATLLRATRALPERNIFRMTYELQERVGTLQELVSALNSTTCVAVGAVNPSSRSVPAPPVPAIALLIKAHDAEKVREEWSGLCHSTVALYKLLSLKVTESPRLAPIKPLKVSGVACEQLDLSDLVDPALEKTALGEVHLSWAVDDDMLIIASHTAWLRQIIRARHREIPNLTRVFEMAGRPPAEHQESILIARTGAISDLSAFWLRYFEATMPEVLDEYWWRGYQPGARDVRLGVQVRVDERRPVLHVESVTPNTPADGILRPGDVIVGCSGRRFATTQPVSEIQRCITRRPNARWVDLWVERNRSIREWRIPIPFVDPIQVLRRVQSVGKLVKSVIYLDDVPDAAGSRSYLTVELRQDDTPLFEFPPLPGPVLPMRGATASGPVPVE